MQRAPSVAPRAQLFIQNNEKETKIFIFNNFINIGVMSDCKNLHAEKGR